MEGEAVLSLEQIVLSLRIKLERQLERGIGGA